MTAPLRPGASFAHLTIRRRVGAGAYGEVWLAHDPRLRRDVALKVLDVAADADPTDDTGLASEARAMARVSHPHIVAVYGLHVDGGRLGIEMEHVAGGSLEDRLRDRAPLPLAQARDVLAGIAAALEASHAVGVFHGDLKPGNVLLTPTGVPKLVDFGLARWLDAGEREAGADPRGGTPSAMAPEALMGDPLGPASDVWSFGVLAYRLLTGRLPFEAATLFELFYAVTNTAAPALPATCPAAVAALVARCLDRRPWARPAAWDEVLAALRAPEAAPGAAIAVRPPPAAPRAILGRDEDVAAAVAGLGGDALTAGAVVVLAGPVGIGKSTVADAVASTLEARGVRRVDVAVSAIEGILRPLAAALDAATASGATAGHAPRPKRSARDEAVAYVDRRVRVLAATGPLLVVAEDLHLAGEDEVRRLHRAIRRLGDVPVAWIVTERTPELAAGAARTRAAGLLGGTRATLRPIGPLSAASIDRLLAARAGGHRVASAAVAAIARRSEGNPLFAAQLFEHLRATGGLRLRGTSWVVDPTAPEAGWPTELRDVVLDRFRALSEFDRAVLEAAAVDGFRFDGAAVAHVAPRRPPLLRVLRSLQRSTEERGLVVAERDGYRFAHPIVQEVLYDHVPPELRRELHRRLAEHLAARPVRPDPERLGTHWERAGDLDAARVPLLEAAHAAARRVETVRAVDLATRAHVVPGPLEPAFARAHADALLWIAVALADSGRDADAEALLAGLAAAADAVGDAVLRARIGVRRTSLRFHGRVGSDADDALVRDATAVLPPGYDLARAHYYLGLRARVRGDLPEAERRFAEAAREAQQADGPAMAGSILDQQASVVLQAGRREEALALYARAADACRTVGQHANAAISDVNAILVELGAGRLDGQVARLLAAQRTLEIEGMPKQAADLGVRVAQVEYALGHTAAALEAATTARTALAALGHDLGLVGAAFVRAELFLVTGRLRDADAALAELRALPRLGGARDAARIDVLEARRALLVGDEARAAARMASAALAVWAIPEPGLHAELLLALAEFTVFGLRPEALRDAVARWPAAAPPTDASVHRAWTAGRAVLALEDGTATSDVLEHAAAALRDPQLVLRRAAYRILAALLAAAADRRRRRHARARAGLEGAEEAAHALDHVAWTLALRATGAAGAPPPRELPPVFERHLEAAERASALRWWSVDRLAPRRRRGR